MRIKLLEVSASYIKSELDEYDPEGKSLIYRAAWLISMLAVGIHFYVLALIMLPFQPVSTMRVLQKFTGDREYKKMADELEDELEKI